MTIHIQERNGLFFVHPQTDKDLFWGVRKYAKKRVMCQSGSLHVINTPLFFLKARRVIDIQ